jgi:hypothetical protein
VPFSQTNITEVFPPTAYGTSILIKWLSNAPDGTLYQVYVDLHLQYHGLLTQCSVPAPPSSDLLYIDVGTVGPGEGDTDFSSSLGEPKNRALLNWEGGTFEGIDLAGFHVYQSPKANDPPNYTHIVKDVPAYIGTVVTDGYGMGGYGHGLYGLAGANYSWTSGTVTTGYWQWAVVPYDMAGNEGASQTVTIFFGLPPQPPGVWPSEFSRHIHYALIAPTGLLYNQNGYGNQGFPGIQAILTWQPSPG